MVQFKEEINKLKTDEDRFGKLTDKIWFLKKKHHTIETFIITLMKNGTKTTKIFKPFKRRTKNSLRSTKKGL